MSHRPPLSPHLQIYRLPLTALLSISHRLTGVLLSLGLVGGLGMLVSLAYAPDIYEQARLMLQTWPGRWGMAGFIFALFFHLCHGIRHLLWDVGYGLERTRLNRLALYELLAATGLTLICLLAARLNDPA